MRRTPEPAPVIPTQRDGAPSRAGGPVLPSPREAADRWVDAVPAPVAGPDTRADAHELRGIVHDLGHGLSTMTLLLAAARAGTVPTFGLLELIEQETERLLAVAHSATGAAGAPSAEPAEPVDVRAVLGPVARLAAHVGETAVRLQPGPAATARIDPAVLSRVVTNLVDNAVRAAGPVGTVRIAVHRAGSDAQDVLVDVVDDGPGFPLGPPGSSRTGLDLVNRLLAACGGRLELRGAAPRGTCARVVLPGLAADRRSPGAR